MEFRLFLFRSPPAVVVRPITSTYISSVSVLSRAIDGSTKKISTHFCTSTPLTCPATPSAAQLMTASAVTLRSASAGGPTPPLGLHIGALYESSEPTADRKSVV